MARRYTRDNRGRFASAGGGATARGGRLKTASGNKRKTQTMKAAGAGGDGVMKGKVQRDPGAMAKRDKVASFAARSKMAAQRIDARKNADLAKFGFKGGAGDRAAANIPMSGTRGKRLDAEISRNVKAGRPVAVSRGSRADAKPQAAPKRTRTPESLRISRAKQIEKRRAIKIDNLPSATLAKRAQNSARTQAAALSVYKGKPKAAPKPAAPRPAAKAAPKASGGLRKRQGGMDARQKESLESARADVSIQKQRLQAARKAKASAAGPIEKIKATGRIDEFSLNLSRAKDRVTRIVARPNIGRPITGAGRFGNTMRNTKPSRPNTMRGKVARDANVRAKIKGAVNLDAGRFKKLYAFNANKAAKAARRR